MWAAAFAAVLLCPLLAVFLQPLLGASAMAAQAAGTDLAATPAFYQARVEPILQANCYRCHAGLNHRGGLAMDTRAALMKGGHDGAVLVPGHPEASLLIKLVRHQGPADDPMPMPPKSKLSDADIAILEQWVRAGAVMPSDSGTR